VIIFEGPDGAGKTTLIKHIAERYDLPVAPRVVGTDTQPMVDLRQWVEDQLATDRYNSNIIFDRHRLISEPIYSLAMGGARDDRFWDLEWLKVSMDKFYDLQPLVIWCLPPLKTVIQNCLDESNDFVRPFIPRIYRGYMAEMARWVGCPGSPYQLTYDYTVHSLPQWTDGFHELYHHWRDR
jgi:hypothetical protein